MNPTKWFTATVLCSLMLIFDGLLHDDDCDFIYLFNMTQMAQLFIINIRNFAYSQRINRHAKLYFKVMVFCVKESFLNTTMLLLGALLCLSVVWVICVTWKVRLLLDDYIVEPSGDKRLYFNHTKWEGPGSKVKVTVRGFQGEDIVMVCTGDKGTWLFNGEQVNESVHRYSFRQDTTRLNLYFLRIYSLQHGDFGTYSFVVNHLNETAYQLVQKGLIRPRNKFDLYWTLCEFTVLEDVPRRERVMVPHGGMLRPQFQYFIFNDDEYLYVDVTVNGQPMELVCDSLKEGCSFFIEKTSSYVRRHENEVIFGRMKLVHVIYRMCMCPSAFGKHSVSYFRRQFNPKKGIFELIEVQNSKTYIVEPLPSPFLNWIIDIIGWDKPTSGNFTMNEHTLQELSLYSQAIELCVSIFLVGLYLITISLTVLYFVIYVLLIIIALYNLHMVRNILIRNQSRNKHTYIVCCEEDTRWSVMNIDPVIKALGHATYIHDRDSHPGQTELEGIRTGMRMCQAFVIVVSQCAVQDPVWEHQVDVVLDRLVRRDVPSYNVLVVRLDGARHPAMEEVIRMRTIKTIVWEEGNSQDQYVRDRYKDVMRWLFACDPHLYLENVRTDS